MRPRRSARELSLALGEAAALAAGIFLGSYVEPVPGKTRLPFDAAQRVIEHAIEAGCKPTTIASLRLQYLERCGPEGICWPGYDDTADETKRHRTTEIRAARDLVDRGVALKVTRYRRECRPDGGPRSNVYVFPAARPLACPGEALQGSSMGELLADLNREIGAAPAPAARPSFEPPRAAPRAEPPRAAPRAEPAAEEPAEDPQRALEVRAIVDALEQLQAAARLELDASPGRARTLIDLAGKATDKEGKPAPRSPAQVRLSVLEVRDELLGGVTLDANGIASRVVRYCKAQIKKAAPIRPAGTAIAAAPRKRAAEAPAADLLPGPRRPMAGASVFVPPPPRVEVLAVMARPKSAAVAEQYLEPDLDPPPERAREPAPS